MPYLVQYLLKLSVAIAVIYLFYALVLRRLTFYNWNRWYLLGYSVLAFVIPFINISPAIEQYKVVGIIPAFGNYAGPYTPVIISAKNPEYNSWDILLITFLTVAGIMLVRLLMRYISYRLIRRSAELLLNGPVKVYQVNMNIIPFSFGKAVFINQQRHSEEDLKKIIEHEFVHIKQNHSADIIWSEIFCILNWYNPFAWLVRSAIRQNLEFIADNSVLESGIDRKQYQYLLLKVTGNTSYSMGNNFNFSSLTKRIAMMNRAKSAGIHLVKFLFILPLVAVMILAFRSSQGNPVSNTNHSNGLSQHANISGDTVPFSKPEKPSVLKQTLKANATKGPDQPVSRPMPDTSFVMDASLEGPGNPYITPHLVGRIDSAAPLLIINGIESPLTINTLDVNLIESITILRGSKAIEKFGPKAKNGVIEIITKEQPFKTINRQIILFTPKRSRRDWREVTFKTEFLDSLNRLQ